MLITNYSLYVPPINTLILYCLFQYLDCLWAQIKKLKQDNWAEKHIPRPYLAFDSILCEALQHNLPTLLPPPHHDSYQYPMPWVVFRMFDYTDCPEVRVPTFSTVFMRFKCIIYILR